MKKQSLNLSSFAIIILFTFTLAYSSEKSIAKSNPKVNVPKAPEKKKSTIAYEEQKVLAQQSQQNGQSPVRQDLPPIDAGAMISSSKIKTLGIMV